MQLLIGNGSVQSSNKIAQITGDVGRQLIKVVIVTDVKLIRNNYGIMWR